MIDSIEPRANALLAAIPRADWLQWGPALEPMDLRAGQVLVEAGRASDHVVFPTTAIVSLLHGTLNGGASEIAAVGREGLVGFSVFMGGQSTCSEAVVQHAGRAFRLPAKTVQATFKAGGPVTLLLLRYTQALIAQIGQTAACNRHHSVDHQLCRCLLHNLDRTPGNELHMTHELIAHLLGVRREGVTEGALKLAQAGLIRYARGHIAVLDRVGLLKRSCECYEVIKNEYERLVPELAAA